MHMADSLVSPIIGCSMIVVAVGVATYSIKKIRQDEDIEKKIPLMGVVGAFVFAAQMINFTIPGTGSSGHIGGGLLLAVLLGPEAGFLALMSVLLLQALFFGDGGILAYGCNVINMGFFGCFIGYNVIFKRITKKGISNRKIFIGSVLGVVIGLQLGAFGVVLETVSSGITELPFSTFVVFMQSIHLVIGIIEGIVTAGVLSFVYENRPEILIRNITEESRISRKRIAMVFILIALIVGGGISLFASSNPDGLEWSMARTNYGEQITNNDFLHETLASIQAKTALLMDYNFKIGDSNEAAWKTVAGVIGVGITAGFIIFILNIVKKGWSRRII